MKHPEWLVEDSAKRVHARRTEISRKPGLHNADIGFLRLDLREVVDRTRGRKHLDLNALRAQRLGITLSRRRIGATRRTATRQRPAASSQRALVTSVSKRMWSIKP